MSYDRRAKVRLESVTYKAAEADEMLSKVYLTLHGLKAGYDAMEEIPSYLRPSYTQLMKVLGLLHPVQQESHQLREMVKRLPR